MAGAKSLLPGFNHNVTHLGKQYHVQTEDSGVANPHVITHLFIGGNVLASKKTSYAELVGAPDLVGRVKLLMQAQHKEMLRQLVHGAFDALEAERSARSWAPGQLEGAAASPAPPPPSSAPPVLAAPTPPPAAAPPRAATPPPAASRHTAPPANGAIHRPAAPPAARPPPPPSAPISPVAQPAAAKPAPPRVDGWGPPVLPRVQAPRPPAPAAARAPAGDRSFDELILAYLAEDLGSKRER